jgi:hypothetical protein
MTKILPVFLLAVFLLSVSSFSYAESESDSPKDPIIKALLEREKLLNEKCRSGSGDSYEKKKYCNEREMTVSALKKKGWCWGYPGQVEDEKVWHDCKDKSKLEKKFPYFLSLDAWECPRPGSLIDNHMSDLDSGCIPPSRKTPKNIAVMDIEKDFAYVCAPVRAGKDIPEGFTSILCNYILVSSIIDKNGQHPDPEKLKDQSGKQTMKTVKDMK